MKIMSFPEILDCENGQQITALQGTVKKVFPAKTGVGDYGAWSLQNLILQDEHAHELTVTWTCEDAFDSGCEGQLLYIESGRDKKDQLAGIKREIKKKTKDGKVHTYESVKVDDRAKVKVLNGAQPKEGEPPPKLNLPYDPRYDTPEKSDPDWPEAPATAPELPLERPNGEAGVMEARKHLMKVCNLYNLCIKATVTSICPNVPDEQRTNDQFQSTLASVWIEASSRRSDDGKTWWSYIDKMPDKPIQ